MKPCSLVFSRFLSGFPAIPLAAVDLFMSPDTARSTTATELTDRAVLLVVAK